jgi:hypothetical protein
MRCQLTAAAGFEEEGRREGSTVAVARAPAATSYAADCVCRTQSFVQNTVEEGANPAALCGAVVKRRLDFCSWCSTSRTLRSQDVGS